MGSWVLGVYPNRITLRLGCLPKNANLIMKDLKYLLAYTVPVSAYLSFDSTGIWTYSAVIYAFVILPVLDLVAGGSAANLDNDTAVKKNMGMA